MTALVVAVGLPASGKTAFGMEMFPRASTRVHLDGLRGMVCDDEHDQDATADAVEIERLILTARCRRRLMTYVDSTNLRLDVRAALVEHARRNAMTPVAVVFDVPFEEVQARNARRDRPVPDEAMQRMRDLFAETVPPFGPLPGFDYTRRISPLLDARFGNPGAGNLRASWL